LFDLWDDTTAYRYNFGYPTISSNDEYMFFSSNIPGGKGHNDIWYIKYDKKAKTWTQPINAEGVNTPEDDVFPFIAENGKLYFASEGHLGMGGMDMFVATSQGEDKWGDVQNLKFPLNSSADDFGIIFEGKQEKGYFTSNRRNGRGGDDIYSFYTAPIIYKISGTVYEIGSLEPVQGAVVKLTDNQGVSVELITDEAGKYSFNVKEGTKDRYIQPETSYTMEVTKKDYLSAKTEESTVGVEESTEFIHDFNIQPTIVDGQKIEIKFPEVLYDLGKYSLRPESKDSLNFLYQTLIDNPTIVIELSAHTDSRGSDNSNQILSENRAKSCVDYLIEKGIAADRMVAVGYGENKLIFSDEDIAKFKTKEEQEAAHQKNRRTVFSVLRDDYVPQSGSTEGLAPEDKVPGEEQ
jgi:peptidoglycan-associated lipoprotein